MLIVYRVICLLIALLVAAVTVRERSLGCQVTGGVVLILLLLWVFLIK